MNEYTPLLRINWRTSLVPEAKVIPAPIVYIKVVADKKAPRLRPDAAERGPAGRRWRAREASSGAPVKPLHRIIATSLETCRRLHRKMRFHWKSHSGLQSTSLLGYFTGKKPLHWKHEGSKPLLQENATSFEIAFKLTTVSKKN